MCYPCPRTTVTYLPGLNSREALGEGDEALASFQSLSGRADSDWQSAARLAEGRLRLIRADIHESLAGLRRLLPPSADSGQIPAEIAQEARLYLSIAHLPEVNETGTTPMTVRPISTRSSLAWKGFPRFALGNREGLDGAPAEAVAPMTDDSPIQDPHQAEQFLERLLASEPPERLAGHARLAWGEFAYDRGDLAAAAARFESAIGKSSNPVSLIAAYNCGVVQFQREEFRAASRALRRVIDGAPGHELSIPALLLRGRAELELGNGEQAAFDLKRAADQSCHDDERSWGTALMGLAYLQSHKSKLATEALFQRRDLVNSEPARSLAAFAVALARFESLTSDEARERETVFLLRALANLDHEAAWLGSCGQVLIGRAYRQLALPEQMAAIYERALSNSLREPHASEMKFALAEQALAAGHHDLGMSRLTELLADSGNPWSLPAGLRLAEWKLSQGDGPACLSLCRELLKRDTSPVATLRLMGAAYEQAGDFKQAAECFAGVAR